MDRSKDSRGAQNGNAQRVTVRSIAWLDGGRDITMRVELENSGRDGAFATGKSESESEEKCDLKMSRERRNDADSSEEYARAKNAA